MKIKKLLAILMAAALTAGLLAGCDLGDKDEDVLSLYEDYDKANQSQNKIGFSVDAAGVAESHINVTFSNPVVNGNAGIVSAMLSLIRIVDAQTLESVEFEARSAMSGIYFNPMSGRGDPEYYLNITIKDEFKQVKYLLVCFDGIGEEVADWETSPLFFVVRVSKESSAILTETPLLIGELFS